MSRVALGGLAALIALALAGCDPPGGVTASDAQALSTSFCQTWLPAVQPVIGAFNAQIQADYRTASTACSAVGEGKAVNAVTVAIAALALYEGVTATYPKLSALADHDLATAHRLIDANRLGADLGVTPGGQ